MSVVKSKRGESTQEFLITARELQLYSIRQCVKFPKRYTFYISQSIARISGNIYENVKLGNSIYPINQHEVQMRRDYFLNANAELYNLVAQIEIANELFGIELPKMLDWMALVDKEINLVKGVMKKDRSRYKNLPAE